MNHPPGTKLSCGKGEAMGHATMIAGGNVVITKGVGSGFVMKYDEWLCINHAQNILRRSLSSSPILPILPSMTDKEMSQLVLNEATTERSSRVGQTPPETPKEPPLTLRSEPAIKKKISFECCPLFY